MTRTASVPSSCAEFGFICEITQVWTVRTVAPCRLLVLEREEYETLARNHQEDARIVLRNLQERAKAVESAGRKYVQNHPVASLTKFLHQQLQVKCHQQEGRNPKY